MPTFSLIFLCAVLITFALRVWLGLRQMQHVAAHRDTVPASFATRIALAEHQKAADYTRAKSRLALIETAIGTVLLLALTLGGLLQSLADLAQAFLELNGYAYGLALFALVGVVGFVVDLPASLYRTFRLEARFGFNTMTPKLFVTDLLKQLLLTALIGAPVLLAVLWLMSHMGALWWFWVWLFWFGFNVAVLLLYPTLIAPLFNKFTPPAYPAGV